jgi:lysyl-tRNA synthetase class 1
LAKVAPRGSERAFVEEKLRRYGIDPSALGAKIDYAINWARDFGAISPERIELSDEERRAIGELIGLIRSEGDEEAIQSAIFEIARRNGLDPRDFFKTLYRILLGIPHGPRLGPYLVAMGRDNVAEALEGALAGSPQAAPEGDAE